MTRKTPYKHPVSSHVRNGVAVKNYERGKGKPEVKSRSDSMRVGAHGVSGYNVVFYFPDGASESYNVGGGTATGAIREAVGRIQQALIPEHAQIRRL